LILEASTLPGYAVRATYASMHYEVRNAGASSSQSDGDVPHLRSENAPMCSLRSCHPTSASVDLKGPRSCSDCGKLLSSVGYERWKTRCPQCEKKRWRKKERLERALLRRAFGNKCRRCGYEKCKDALHFHHKDASEKHLWSRHGEASVREIKAHPERFELLCANCHIELHVNLRRRHHQAV